MTWYRDLLATWWFVGAALIVPLAIWSIVGIYGVFESEEERIGWFRAEVMGLMLFGAFILGHVIR